MVEVDPVIVATQPGQWIKRLSFRDRGVYSALRFALWLMGSVPRNYARFLDFAASRILLRKAGGGYIFIHRMLLDYFASQGKETAKNEGIIEAEEKEYRHLEDPAEQRSDIIADDNEQVKQQRW